MFHALILYREKNIEFVDAYHAVTVHLFYARTPLSSCVSSLDHLGLGRGILFFGIFSSDGIMWTFVRDDPVEKGYDGYAAPITDSGFKSRSSILPDLARVFRYKNTWVLTLTSASLAGPLLTFTGLWGIPYLTTHYHLTPVQSASMISTLLIAWALGGPILGALSERMGRRKPLYFGALCIALIGWLPVVFSQSLPLWLAGIIFGLIGFASSAIIIGFAFVKESVPPSLAGTVTGVCNMGMEMGPMLLQPAIGWVLDCRWNGVLEHGIPAYDIGAYQSAFSLMIALSLVGALIIAFAKETFCQQLDA